MKTSQVISLRECFQAPKGFVWNSVDFAAQELRYAAAASKCPTMRDIYVLEYEYRTGIKNKPISPEGKEYTDPNIDLHLKAATFINPEVKRIVKEEPWNADKDKNSFVKKVRKAGKEYNFGLIYLATPASFVEKLNCTLEEAEAQVKAYFSYPEGFYQLGYWLQSVATLGSAQRFIKTPLGNHIFINQANAKGLSDTNTIKRKAANHAIQAPCAEMTKIALINVAKEFEKLDWKYKKVLGDRRGIIGPPVHDELNVLVPGDCNIERVEKVNDQGITCVKYKSSLDLNNPEHLMAHEYSQATKNGMEKAMRYIFDLVNSDIPALAEMSINRYWDH
jgi:DNA polymerase I-like protein with 3'-5' exonuclease and polymerase domains